MVGKCVPHANDSHSGLRNVLAARMLRWRPLWAERTSLQPRFRQWGTKARASPDSCCLYCPKLCKKSHVTLYYGFSQLLGAFWLVSELFGLFMNISCPQNQCFSIIISFMLHNCMFLVVTVTKQMSCSYTGMQLVDIQIQRIFIYLVINELFCLIWSILMYSSRLYIFF